MDLLIHLAIMTDLVTSELDASIFGKEEDNNKHIATFPFTISGQNTPEDSWTACLQIRGVPDWKEKLLPQINKEDEDFIEDVKLGLFERMKI